MTPASTTDDAARGWLHRVLAERGLDLSGTVERVHVTAWSTVSRVPTSQGPVWLKENGPGSAYEAALVQALGDWVPGHVVGPLAVDTERGWSLLPDGGATLRSVHSQGADPAAPGQPGPPGPDRLRQWEVMLGRYAELQRTLAGRVPELLALGVPDMRPELMPGRRAVLLDDPVVWAGLAPDRYEAVRRMEPAYGRWCAELAEGGIPLSLQHDDLHDANVFFSDGGYRFFDWGDASVAHPFGSLLIVLRAAARRFDLKPGDGALVRLRDAYLEPWSGGLGWADLVFTADTAVRVAKVGRALAWQRALLGAGPSGREQHGEAVPRWVEQLVEPDIL